MVFEPSQTPPLTPHAAETPTHGGRDMTVAEADLIRHRLPSLESRAVEAAVLAARDAAREAAHAVTLPALEQVRDDLADDLARWRQSAESAFSRLQNELGQQQQALVDTHRQAAEQYAELDAQVQAEGDRFREHINTLHAECRVLKREVSAEVQSLTSDLRDSLEVRLATLEAARHAPPPPPPAATPSDEPSRPLLARISELDAKLTHQLARFDLRLNRLLERVDYLDRRIDDLVNDSEQTDRRLGDLEKPRGLLGRVFGGS